MLWAGLGLLLVLAVGLAVLVKAGLGLVAPVPAVLGEPPQGLASMRPMTFPSESGSFLHGWFAPPAVPGNGAVVLLNGYRTNRGMMAGRAAALLRAGFGVLLFDFQATGESPGRHITFGRLEGLDARAAVDEVRRRLPGERVGAIGVSLGGAALAMAPQPPGVDAAVLESAFPTLDSALRNRLRSHTGLPEAGVAVAAPLFEALMPVILGFSVGAVRPVDRIGGIGAPVLVISGEEDTRTTIGEARALFDAAREPKAFWAVPGAGHVDLERFGPAAYWERVMPFLMGRLRGP